MQSGESHNPTKEISEESKETMKSKKTDRRKKRKLKERSLKEEASEADNTGVCYLRRIPPHMDHVRLRQILSRFGEILRIDLVTQDAEAQMFRHVPLFSEGWVEFAKKSAAEQAADMLHGQEIGGEKRSSIYYDIWDIKYLTKKWDDLTEEIACKRAKAEKLRAVTEIDARMKMKQKTREESGSNAEAASVFPPRVVIHRCPSI